MDLRLYHPLCKELENLTWNCSSESQSAVTTHGVEVVEVLTRWSLWTTFATEANIIHPGLQAEAKKQQVISYLWTEVKYVTVRVMIQVCIGLDACVCVCAYAYITIYMEQIEPRNISYDIK